MNSHNQKLMENQDDVTGMHCKEISIDLRNFIPKVLVRKVMLNSPILFRFFVFVSEVRCPALPKVPVGTYIPAECDDGSMRFHSNCELRCPFGYHIATGPPSQTSISRICNTDGTWAHVAVSPTCKGMSRNNHFILPNAIFRERNQYSIFFN